MDSIWSLISNTWSCPISQADEMWTGVTYAVAAFMIQQVREDHSLIGAFTVRMGIVLSSGRHLLLVKVPRASVRFAKQKFWRNEWVWFNEALSIVFHLQLVFNTNCICRATTSGRSTRRGVHTMRASIDSDCSIRRPRRCMRKSELALLLLFFAQKASSYYSSQLRYVVEVKRWRSVWKWIFNTWVKYKIDLSGT